MENYDFSGWATRVNIKCSDGRTIMKDAFKHCDGQRVPLIWNHEHNDPLNVLGHALLENRDEGVYAYCSFNETDAGLAAKQVVKHGDVVALSIYANKLQQDHGKNVTHGEIREVSLVLAGANPGAYIDSVMSHGEGSEEEGVISFVEEQSTIEMYHAEDSAKEDPEKEETKEKSKDESLKDVFDTLSEKQQNAVFAIVGQIVEDLNKKNEDNEGEKEMKQNAFDKDERTNENVLSHADQEAIIELAKQPGVGSFKAAFNAYAEKNSTLAHGFEDVEALFPEYKDLHTGAPETLTRDQSWVSKVMSKISKSPISRIRTKQMDARGLDLRALGYSKGEQKKLNGQMKLMQRTTDPQTVYVKDAMHRDDIIDITDFDVVAYQYKYMRQNLDEEIATAILIGDGREDIDPDKISEEHIRSIWNDKELYTIRADVDIAKAKTELQGSGTGVSFGENYVYAEAILTAALYSREKYKGSGKPDFFCTPHLVNVMLLARDMNGRRIYDSISDLTAALNVNEIITVEQFEGKTRVDDKNNTKKLLGIFVNLADYQAGSTKGGEIAKFEDFDIDFNQYKYLMETRLSGALKKVFSAIVLEEPVTAANPEEPNE